MVIETRYRDITPEEYMPFHTRMLPREPGLWEQQLRGKPITIAVPRIPEQELTVDQKSCGEPWYRVVRGPVDGCSVCPHIAEIGD